MNQAMNCQQFQEILPYIIESGGSAEEDGHLRTCPACAELVQDLEYIAQQAKLLLPMHDPSPRVWAGIEASLHRQALLQEGRMSLLGHNMTAIAPQAQAKSWTPIGWAMALLALAAFSWALISYHPQLPPAPTSAENISAQPVPFESDDQQLLTQVSQQAPDVRRAYEDSLREVNTYITDAQQAVDQNPEDAAARAHLLDAYQQKEMLYQMATVRALP
jgi:hypothetical protein